MAAFVKSHHAPLANSKGTATCIDLADSAPVNLGQAATNSKNTRGLRSDVGDLAGRGSRPAGGRADDLARSHPFFRQVSGDCRRQGQCRQVRSVATG